MLDKLKNEPLVVTALAVVVVVLGLDVADIGDQATQVTQIGALLAGLLRARSKVTPSG